MGVLLRVLGLQALAELAGAMPARTARVLTLVMLVGANLFPLVALLTGAWEAGDVLITYWLENVAVGVWQVVKLLTVQGTDPVRAVDASGAPLPPGGIVLNGAPVQLPLRLMHLAVAAFFTVHYGMFTLVHGVFTFILARQSGITGSVRSFALAFLVLLGSHGLSTAIHWFGRGERRTMGLGATMRQPYGRIFVLHLAVLGSAFLLMGGSWSSGSHGPGVGSEFPGGFGTPNGTPSILPGVLLIALKTMVDAGFHVRAHRAATASTSAMHPVPTS